MTIWNTIYKQFKNGGAAWATLSEEVHPLFTSFVNQSTFEVQSAFDIGCGTGKYLKALQSQGFKTAGIDSSDIAVQMTKSILDDDSDIFCVNMFTFEIPKNRYDFIISISTIHHGTKKSVEQLVNTIYEVLVKNGKFFITVPDFEANKKKNNFKDQEEIEVGTFVPVSGPEKGLPHSFYTKEEAKKLFSKFNNVQVTADSYGRWVIRGSK
ncbi:MAG: class I SAM-dependent methyltransferase [Candidatus Magasanikbacteria bacterium]|jgi:SAM-dependent methyltransferase|nr:class I SAM-dependent methyltransferase [Candidatus Magasanikbacteria bacterium]